MGGQSGDIFGGGGGGGFKKNFFPQSIFFLKKRTINYGQEQSSHLYKA